MIEVNGSETDAEGAGADPRPHAFIAKPGKVVVLVFMRYYLPGYKGGGPIRTIENLVNRLSDQFEFLIVTSDRDLGDSSSYPGIVIDSWNHVGKAKVFYASSGLSAIWRWRRLIHDTSHDVLYLNSFFDPRFTLAPLLAAKVRKPQLRKPIILAPRGEFSRGAFAIKRFKKNLYLQAARLLGLFEGIVWQGSTSSEIDDVKRMAPNHDIVSARAGNLLVVPDLASDAARTIPKNDSNVNGEEAGHLRVCFVARIAPVKNLDFALRVLSKVKVPMHFSIYGPKESQSHWEECAALIRELPGHVKVEYKGELQNAEVRKVISEYDLYFVPSRGENFGHGFIEALSAGVPILVSDQTPWRDLRAQGLGWDIPLDRPDMFVAAIEEAAKLANSERTNIRLRCIEFAFRIANDSEALRANEAMFRKAISFFYKQNFGRIK